LVLAAAPAHAAETAPASLPAAPRTAETPPATYTVVAGDTVSDIAARFGLRTQDVLTANGLGWSSIIQPGQVLALTATDTVAQAATAVSAASVTASHTVVAGDTVSAIAAAGGTTVAAVLAANGLSWDSIIYPGQVLAVPTSDGTAALGLDAEQIANARIIIAVGRELGVPDRGIQIALGTAMQESWLRNLGWGDRDSLGLFQQRPSAGWGTAEQVTDPERAARAFYGGPSDPNGTLTRGLLDVPGWETMSFADAAQAVQVSAYPDRYAQWEGPASTWLSVLG
ncbi:MAG: LysM peptidoglycan-binding domain-containing protein, partial [Microbacterium sp.]|uniref:LysM peptidoglycan-binding domain-containing protein n=1 Tax=Microbacterium sp. TaxID=51671 RepID=UPI0039E61ECB